MFTDQSSKTPICKYIYSYFDHYFKDKLPLITKEASIMKTTQLSELPTILKIVSQSGSSTRGEESANVPRNIRDVVEALKTRFM
jgi:hypothetical protein